MMLKFIYSEKATKLCKISNVDLSYVVPVKSPVDVSQNFVAVKIMSKTFENKHDESSMLLF